MKNIRFDAINFAFEELCKDYETVNMMIHDKWFKTTIKIFARLGYNHAIRFLKYYGQDISKADFEAVSDFIDFFEYVKHHGKYIIHNY